jgi:hypothetical protein
MSGTCSNIGIRFYSEKPNGRDHLGDVGIDERTILKCILKEMLCIGFKWPRIRSSGCLL